jgi:hypothetical protein
VYSFSIPKGDDNMNKILKVTFKNHIVGKVVKDWLIEESAWGFYESKEYIEVISKETV